MNKNPNTREDRLHIAHLPALFDEKIIHELALLLDSYVDEGQEIMTDRELKLLRQGVLPDKVRFDRSWYSIFESNLRDYVDIFYPFSLITFPVVVRRVQDKGNHFVPWHQDIAYMKTLPKHKMHRQTLTCFVPLDKNPSMHTTLQFSQENIKIPHLIYEHSPLLQNYGLGIDRNFEDSFNFNLERGDALVFGDHTIHRTFTPPAKRVDRMSLEFRLIKEVDKLPDRDYFSLKDKHFIQT